MMFFICPTDADDCQMNGEGHCKRCSDLELWVAERLANCERIAKTKTGDDRKDWLEDAGYFRAVLARLTKTPTEAVRTTEQEPCAWRWHWEGSNPMVWSYGSFAPIDPSAVDIEPLYAVPWVQSPLARRSEKP